MPSAERPSAFWKRVMAEAGIGAVDAVGGSGRVAEGVEAFLHLFHVGFQGVLGLRPDNPVDAEAAGRLVPVDGGMGFLIESAGDRPAVA